MVKDIFKILEKRKNLYFSQLENENNRKNLLFNLCFTLSRIYKYILSEIWSAINFKFKKSKEENCNIKFISEEGIKVVLLLQCVI